MKRTKAELEAIARDGQHCRRCGRFIRDDMPYSVHHRLRRSAGTKAEVDQVANLVLVCGTGTSPHCHSWIHSHPDESFNDGWLIRRGDDLPEKIPLAQASGRWFWLTEDGGVIYADTTVPRLHL